MIICDTLKKLAELGSEPVTGLRLTFEENFDIGLLLRFKQHLRQLDISVKGFLALGDEIAEFANLEFLNIENCPNLQHISPKLGLLPKLSELKIKACKLKQLPDFEGDFELLANLNLQYNSLRALPQSLTRAKKLLSINLESNAFRAAPELLVELPNLQSINLSDNRQMEELWDLRGRKPMWRDLYLVQTRLNSLPYEVCALPNLGLVHIMRTDIDWVEWLYGLPGLDMAPQNTSKMKHIYIAGAPSGRRVYFTWQFGDSKQFGIVDLPSQSRAFSQASLDLLAEVCKIDIAPAERRRLMQFFGAQKGKAAWLTRHNLYYLAQLRNNLDMNNAVQAWLEAQAVPLATTQNIALLGDLQTDKQSALSRCTELGLTVGTKVNAATNVAVIGIGISAADAEQLRQRPDLQLVGLKALRDFFDLHHDFYLKNDETQDEQRLEALRALMQSSNMESVDLMLTLLEEGGLPQPLITEFWAVTNLLYLCGEEQRHLRAKNIMHQAAPKDWEKAIFPSRNQATVQILDRLERQRHWLDMQKVFDIFEQQGILYTNRRWADMRIVEVVREAIGFIERHKGIHIKHLPSADWLKHIPTPPLLSMAGSRINTLPQQLFDMKELKALELSDNKLTSLPNDFQKLISLETLNISDNYIRSFPPVLDKMPKLKTIHCRNTPFALAAKSAASKGKNIQSINLNIWKTTDFETLERIN